MERKLLLSLFVGFGLMPLSVVAQSIPAPDNSQNIPIEKLEEKPAKRPKLPSRQHVECVYADGTLHFDFVIPEGEAVLIVIDGLTGISAQYVFDTDAHAEVTIGYLSAASLEIHTDAGNTYTGTIQ